MQSKEYAKWILSANIITWPLAYFIMNKWLDNFAYKTDISLTMFIIAGGTTLVISLLTVSYQTIKSAMTNPIEILRKDQ